MNFSDADSLTACLFLALTAHLEERGVTTRYDVGRDLRDKAAAIQGEGLRNRVLAVAGFLTGPDKPTLTLLEGGRD